MADLPQPWDAYASAQTRLSKRSHVGDRSWGLEAALNQLVIDAPPPLDQLATVQATAERRARYSRSLISRNTTILSAEAPRAEAQIEARSDLSFLGRNLATSDITVLVAAGLGHPASSEAVRQQLARARRRARKLLVQ